MTSINNNNALKAIEILNSVLDKHFLVQPGTAFDLKEFAEHYGVNPADLDAGDVVYCNSLSYPKTPLLFTLVESDLIDNPIGKHGVKSTVLTVNFDGTWYYANNDAGEIGAQWNPLTDELSSGDPYSNYSN